MLRNAVLVICMVTYSCLINVTGTAHLVHFFEHVDILRILTTSRLCTRAITHRKLLVTSYTQFILTYNPM
jgi:hypothetical protein